MKISKRMGMTVIIASLACAIWVGGCGSWTPLLGKHQMDVELNAELASEQWLEAETHNGNVVINGAETNQCHIDAVIKVKALTDDDAQRITDEIKLELVSTSKGLLLGYKNFIGNCRNTTWGNGYLFWAETYPGSI